MKPMNKEIIFTGVSQGKGRQLMIAAANHIKDGGTVSMPGRHYPDTVAANLGYLITREVEHSPMMTGCEITGYEFKLKEQ